MNPNGWRRLFLVISVLWLVPVLSMTYLQWPTVRFVSFDPLVGEPDTPNYINYEALAQKYGGFHVNARGHAEPLHVNPFEAKVSATAPPGLSRIEYYALVYQAYVQDVHQRQQTVIGGSLIGWILPVTMLYALGAAVAWIRRGFTGNTAKGGQ